MAHDTLPEELKKVLKELGIERMPLEAKVEAVGRDIEGGVVAKGMGGSLKEIVSLSEKLMREAEEEEE